MAREPERNNMGFVKSVLTLVTNWVTGLFRSKKATASSSGYYVSPKKPKPSTKKGTSGYYVSPTKKK